MTTEDGYILRLDHILPSNKSQVREQRPVVLLQHGISDSSITWVINQPQKALAFQLVRAGFDVWMGNNRGNINSRRHITLDPTSYEFWNFDFEDMGLYDQPAQIDFILERTGVKKLAAYLGHSEGTT